MLKDTKVEIKIITGGKMCDKVRHTKKEAASILNAMKVRKQFRKEIRYYYCKDCNAWHLTSKEFGIKVAEPVRLSLIERWKKLLKTG